jgi:hypothetical protein
MRQAPNGNDQERFAPLRSKPSGEVPAPAPTVVSPERRLCGFVSVASTTETPLPADTEARLAEFTDLVATAVANAENRAELAASRARIVATADGRDGESSATCTTGRSNSLSRWRSRCALNVYAVSPAGAAVKKSSGGGY